MYMGVGLCMHMCVCVSELCVYVASEQENGDRQVNSSEEVPSKVKFQISDQGDTKYF